MFAETFLSHVLDKSCNLPVYTAAPNNSLYRIPDQLRISMAGDWGTGTDEAATVAKRLEDCNADLTVHLGDVYYIGDKASIGENCLDIPNPANNYLPVKWPIGTMGSFALLGNHEMYATGQPYVDEFLPVLGMKASGKVQGQGTSYFCLENQNWRIIAIDTGYHSRGLPGTDVLAKKVHFLSFLAPSCKIPDDELTWLDQVLKLKNDQEHALILLSHHQYYTSSPEPDYTKAAEQLDAFIQRPVLWFWGHEHSMAGYELSGPKRLQAHGRCIGHGGMPVDRWEAPDQAKRGNLLFYDRRLYHETFGMNGYVTMDFANADLTVKYFDLRGADPLIEEKWRAAGGQIQRIEVKQNCFEVDFYGPQKWG